MILDATYLLPLARIAIDLDLLDAIAKGKTSLKLEEITVSLISIFELQMKAAKLMVPTEFVVKATNAIFNAFKVESFYNTEIIKVSYKLKKLIPDYIDCVIVATAIILKESLITENSLILVNAEVIKKGVRCKRVKL
ncbi:MAG: hypothetical protein QXR82_01980 [Candidatus Bathyarchaeia archaeon]|nr:hypothetical protein [Candidatus Bathyarchaeota archaeon]